MIAGIGLIRNATAALLAGSIALSSAPMRSTSDYPDQGIRPIQGRSAYQNSSSRYSGRGNPNREFTEYDWITFVANRGGQEAVDACLGGLTDMTAQAQLTNKGYLGYFPIHNHCGGEPILNLETGDHVFIRGYGAFQVVGLRDVEQGDTTRALAGLPGVILLQTCHETGTEMRVVALDLSW